MRTILIFVVLQLLASGYACWRGGAPERWVAVLLVLALAGTILAPLQPAYTYRAVNWPLLRVDLLLLFGLTAVALVADRFWPMWIAALQLVDVATHGVRAYRPDIVQGAYWWLESKIAYPMLIVLVVGVWRHRRRREAGQLESGWTRQRLRADDVAGCKPPG